MRVGTNDYVNNIAVLCVDIKHGDQMGLRRSEIVTLRSLDRLRGGDRPLAIDNYTFMEILKLTDLEFLALENEIGKEKHKHHKAQIEARNLAHDLKREKIKFNLSVEDVKTLKIEMKKIKGQPIRTFLKSIFGLWPH